jgi:hypothetical protein
MMSIPDISRYMSIPKSTVRKILLDFGVNMRTKSEALALVDKSRFQHAKGKKVTFSKEWRENISKGRKKWSEKNAKGTTLKKSGYVEITKGPNKFRREHVLVMELYLGRRLGPGECVHHMDENKSNNDINNLQLMTRSEHARHHRLEEIKNNIKRKRESNGRFS